MNSEKRHICYLLKGKTPVRCTYLKRKSIDKWIWEAEEKTVRPKYLDNMMISLPVISYSFSQIEGSVIRLWKENLNSHSEFLSQWISSVKSCWFKDMAQSEKCSIDSFRTTPEPSES